jgi:hypothetical protein
LSTARRRRGFWRDLVASLWVLVPLLTFGVFSGGALLYAGVRAKVRRWQVWGVVYGAVGIVATVLWTQDANVGDIDTSLGSFGLAVAFFLIFVTTVHSLAIRADFLDRISEPRGPALRERPSEREHAERVLAERAEALEIVREDPVKARELGIGRPEVRGGYHGHLVDLNHASAGAVADLPRMDEATAKRLVALRDEVGGFASLEDAAHLLDIPPATVERLRGLAVCLPY